MLKKTKAHKKKEVEGSSSTDKYAIYVGCPDTGLQMDFNDVVCLLKVQCVKLLGGQPVFDDPEKSLKKEVTLFGNVFVVVYSLVFPLSNCPK